MWSGVAYGMSSGMANKLLTLSQFKKIKETHIYFL